MSGFLDEAKEYWCKAEALAFEYAQLSTKNRTYDQRCQICTIIVSTASALVAAFTAVDAFNHGGVGVWLSVVTAIFAALTGAIANAEKVFKFREKADGFWTCKSSMVEKQADLYRISKTCEAPDTEAKLDAVQTAINNIVRDHPVQIAEENRRRSEREFRQSNLARIYRERAEVASSPDDDVDDRPSEEAEGMIAPARE